MGIQVELHAAGERVRALPDPSGGLFDAAGDFDRLLRHRVTDLPLLGSVDLHGEMHLGQQGALTGRYSPERPLPEGTNRATAYNGVPPHLQALADRLAVNGAGRGASAVDVAIAWVLAMVTTPIVGVTKADYLNGLAQARAIDLTVGEIAELEALADTVGVDTRGWWEQEM